MNPTILSVRYFALTELLDKPQTAADVRAAKAAINASRPVDAILAGSIRMATGSSPVRATDQNTRGTVWQLIFLDQLGADVRDARMQSACDYVLAHTQTPNGGFGAAPDGMPTPPNSTVAHCLHGNLLRALLGFGYGADERVQRAIEWQARAITGDGSRLLQVRHNRRGLRLRRKNAMPCAWGAIKALRALARVPADAQSTSVKKAIRAGVAFLLSHDPAVADYPAGYGRINSSWFKLGFPSGYVADVLQNLEALAELGHVRDKRLRPAIDWLLSKQDAQGRWKNQYAYSGKLWADIEPQGAPSKWVTLRACRVLKSAESAPL